MAPFTFPADYGLSSTTSMDTTDFFTHPAPPLPPDFFPHHQPELSVPAVWDPTSAFSWLPASTQQPSGPATQWDDAAHWDDLVSSFQPTTARPPSTGSSEEMSLVTAMPSIFSWQILVMDIPPQDSRPVRRQVSLKITIGHPGGHQAGHVQFRRRHRVILATQVIIGHPPSVSVEIGQWDGTNWTLLTCRAFLTHVLNVADTFNFSCVEADFHLADEAMDMDARLGWDFKPSNVRWLDPDVSSEVAEFPQGIRLTGKNKIYAFHRVTAAHPQFPFFRKRTGYLINLTDMKDMNPDLDVTVDQLIRDQDSHSWVGAPGLEGERRELNPEDIRILAAATLRTREMQDNTEVPSLPPELALQGHSPGRDAMRWFHLSAVFLSVVTTFLRTGSSSLHSLDALSRVSISASSST
ncbi:hypothetical protein DFH08DRAFT_1081989 [Mycena albidolilacea]|uniref:Uncharacterized protein n=1 Tax=Mycena albidolilacea TaxID=1033008 RepID=A0AAD7ENN4_9AGAR|nr:hypothetical protein DFH08DRAFT_1081989 [Mycena albidolilacea]